MKTLNCVLLKGFWERRHTSLYGGSALQGTRNRSRLQISGLNRRSVFLTLTFNLLHVNKTTASQTQTQTNVHKPKVWNQTHAKTNIDATFVHKISGGNKCK